MKNPFNRQVGAPNLPREAYDLSSKSLYSAPFGALIPSFCREVHPGDHIEISPETFTRVAPLNTCAYVRLKEHREFFFVNYRYLWSYWSTFITTVEDYNSSTLANQAGERVPTAVPLLDGSYLYYALKQGEDSFMPANESDFFGISWRENAKRLLNMLGYGSDVNGKWNDGNIVSVNPFRLLAYQKIFYDYYRLGDFDRNVVGAYNIDQFTVSPASGGSFPETFPQTATSSEATKSLFRHLLSMHYRPYKKDYFTGVRPSAYWYGGSASASHNEHVRDYEFSLLGLPRDLLNPVPPGTEAGTGIRAFNGQTVSLDASLASAGITTTNLRTLYAIEKYLTRTLKAGKHYDDQILAHFGVRPPSDTSHEVKFLGGISSPISIGEVVSTADTAGSGTGAALGKIAGKGVNYGSDNETFTYDAKEHGILMCIYSCSIDSDYDAVGLDPFNYKQKRTDYYDDAFDGLGPHVVRSIYSDARKPANRILGLSDPWLEYKSSVDKVYGSFMTDGLNEAYTASREVVSNNEESTVDNMTLRSLYTNPRLLNQRIVALDYDGRPETDPFFVNDYYSCKIVRNIGNTQV